MSGVFARETFNQQNGVMERRGELEQMRAVEIPNIRIDAALEGDVRRLVTGEAKTEHAEIGSRCA